MPNSSVTKPPVYFNVKALQKEQMDAIETKLSREHSIDRSKPVVRPSSPSTLARRPKRATKKDKMRKKVFNAEVKVGNAEVTPRMFSPEMKKIANS